MTLQEFYAQIGGNYADTVRRLCNESLVLRFVKKYPANPSFDELCAAAQHALACGDVRALGAALGNVLEPVSRRMRPEIDRAICAIEENGAVGARMTGSGSAVFGVFMHAGACRRATDRLVTAYPTCRMMRTAAHGIVIEEEA